MTLTDAAPLALLALAAAAMVLALRMPDRRWRRRIASVRTQSGRRPPPRPSRLTTAMRIRRGRGGKGGAVGPASVGPSLELRLVRAGVALSPGSFYAASLAAGLVCAGAVILLGAWIAAPLALFAGAVGGPRWSLAFLAGRRRRKFLESFAEAIDLIVRGIRTGLPVGECLRIVGRESPDPVGAEFRRLGEGMDLGLTLRQCLERTCRRMPVAEVNFFMIVLTLQQKTGGNLSETLSNLSAMLRQRRRMQAKVRAVSQEARSSAAIIAALPVAVMGLVGLSAPDYLQPLFSTRGGNIMLVAGLAWMGTGVLVMRRMINFTV